MTEGDTPVSDAAGEQPKFRLHVVSVALAILSLLGHLARGYAMAKGSGQTVAFGIGYGLGGFAVVLVVAYVLGWALYRVSGRFSFIGNLVFCLVILMGNCAGLGHRAA